MSSAGLFATVWADNGTRCFSCDFCSRTMSSLWDTAVFVESYRHVVHLNCLKPLIRFQCTEAGNTVTYVNTTAQHNDITDEVLGTSEFEKVPTTLEFADIEEGNPLLVSLRRRSPLIKPAASAGNVAVPATG